MSIAIKNGLDEGFTGILIGSHTHRNLQLGLKQWFLQILFASVLFWCVLRLETGRHTWTKSTCHKSITQQHTCALFPGYTIANR